ncbi:hypothetical protein LVJ94_51805 [Pendulispora rubella]|uniref:Uncharacterized protein n=1 Tax=Pendulispora rubella TaxID=2741070 RepID=A0ABZ2L870_9BACT
MSKRILGSLSVGAFAVVAVLAVDAPAMAESVPSERDTIRTAAAEPGVDRIAMWDVEVDLAARTFSFNTSERFGGPLEHVVATWTGDDRGFDYAIESLREHPELFHVFRLYDWKNGKAKCKYYYHTAG